ncbi:hypothetical protein [Lactococcus termiticola]|uniref:Uncharacterized protein n=1 Tax=Lactococcus termiticola TaxID=2169526 RepID=A0A2R5HK29_9LACT|nr:hypothetical protein [Lactococcus termiticola]GBG97100.1 hypothetical protein NtB2_01237 [Lactococcus termiticola]
MNFLLIISVVVTLFANIPYAIASIQGKVRPNKISWLIWTLAPSIGLVASLSKGFDLGQMPVLVSVASTALILLSSFVNRKAYWEIRSFDWTCLVLALLALLLWYFTKNPDTALILSLVADLLAVMPTLVKSWRHPETEGIGPYLAGVINAIVAVLLIQHWNFTTSAFPIYLFLVNLILFAVIFGRQRKLVKHG